MEGLIFFIIAMVWAAIDQAKHDREVEKRKEERRKNSSSFKFFWE